MSEKEQLNTAACRAFSSAELSDDARQLFERDTTPETYLASLSKTGLFPDAVRFLACLLGPRRSVLWASGCIRALDGDRERSPEQTAALDSVDRWLEEGSDGNRRAARKAAERANLKTPEGCVAMAAFLSEGSIAPSHIESVPVPPLAAEKMAAGAIMIAVVKDPRKAGERFERCLSLAMKDVNE